jgi:hypothetical protein
MDRHKVRYLIVGGYAVMLYSEPRWTKDLDLWIALTVRNSRAVFKSLREFGAPLAGLTAKDFSEPGHYFQMGNPPMRVDVMMAIPGVEFEAAWKRRNTVSIEGLELHFISRDDLIQAKLASGRRQDLADVRALKRSVK